MPTISRRAVGSGFREFSMSLRTYFALGAIVLPQLAMAQSIEPNAMISNGITESQARILASAVTSRGYSCDSISGATPHIVSSGYNLYCNQHRFKYVLENVGGRYVVKAQ
jgi:hypothetical protein